jgi:hypothetical protein
LGSQQSADDKSYDSSSDSREERSNVLEALFPSRSTAAETVGTISPRKLKRHRSLVVKVRMKEFAADSLFSMGNVASA